MTAAPAPEITPPATGPDGEVHHLTCCDDDIAMCGADLTGQDWCDRDCGCVPCPLCALVNDEGLPCPAPECPGMV